MLFRSLNNKKGKTIRCVGEKDNSVQGTIRITIKRSNVEYNRVYQDTCYCSAIDEIYSSPR